MKAEILGSVLLLAWSGEILLRRWVWNQVPTQVGAITVYALLLANVVFLSVRWWSLLRGAIANEGSLRGAKRRSNL